MAIKSNLLFWLGAFTLISTSLGAQPLTNTTMEDHSYRPIILKLNEDGSKYVRFIMWHQLWVTSNNLSDDQTPLQLTTSIRRSRFMAYAQISSRFLLLTHWGLNSLSPSNLSSLGNNDNAPQLFLHGAWGELKVSDALYVGTGLHYWNGLTRLASQSTLNLMTLDHHRPFYHLHSLGITDQFARHLGVYIKGNLGKFDYRLAWNNPGKKPLDGGIDYSSVFNDGVTRSTLSYTGVLAYNTEGHATGNSIFAGYFRYNLWDAENTKRPYNVGTYLGTKRVLALGAGFFTHPNGMYDSSNHTHANVAHFAVDGFLDMPLGHGAINSYASMIHYNYGKNYIGRWAGTGTVLYGQLGYLVARAKVMPYIAFSHATFNGAPEAITAWDAGINYFINGHNAKLTIEYHNIARDYREEGIIKGRTESLSQVRVQLHIFI